MRTRVLISACLIAACSPPMPMLDGGTEVDAGRDASVAFDAGSTDAGTDAGVDAGVDAGRPDAGIDAGFDAGPPQDAGFFTQLDAGPGDFSAVWTNGSGAWIVGLDGLILHRRPGSAAWTRVDAGTNDLLLTLTVDGLGRVHAGGRTSSDLGVTLMSADGGEHFVEQRNGLPFAVNSLASAGDLVFAAADVVLFLDGGAWDRSMPQPSSPFPGSLTARGAEVWATGFAVVHHFIDGGWREEMSGGELGMDVCTSIAERTLVSEHGFVAMAGVTGPWSPWPVFIGNEPVGCDYAPDGTLWIAGNRFPGTSIEGIVLRSRGGVTTEWILPPLRAISVSNDEVLIIGSDAYVGRLIQP